MTLVEKARSGKYEPKEIIWKASKIKDDGLIERGFEFYGFGNAYYWYLINMDGWKKIYG